MRIAVTPISVAGDTDGIGETRTCVILFCIHFISVNSTESGFKVSRKRRIRCKQCDACNSTVCGECRHCKNPKLKKLV